MLTIWVLIIYSTVAGATVISTQKFDTKAGCTTVGEEAIRAPAGVQIDPEQPVAYKCIEVNDARVTKI